MKKIRVRIRSGWEGVGRKGTVLGNPIFHEQDWLPVLWDGESDPDFIKMRAVEVLDSDNESDGLRKALEDIMRHLELSIGKEGARLSAVWNIANKAVGQGREK